jgi:hypothetical protein
MHDGVDGLLTDDFSHKFRIADITFIKGRFISYCPAKSGDKIIDDYRAMASVNESQYRVAANISRTAGHKNVELFCHLVFFPYPGSPVDQLRFINVREQKKATQRLPFNKKCGRNQGLVGELSSLPEAITIPPTTAAAARTATITPLPPPSLLSSLVLAPTRFTLEAPTAFAAGERDSAITGALTSEAAAIAAREILPKRIIELLIVEVRYTSNNPLRSSAANSSHESCEISTFSISSPVLLISYNIAYPAK